MGYQVKNGLKLSQLTALEKHNLPITSPYEISASSKMRTGSTDSQFRLQISFVRVLCATCRMPRAVLNHSLHADVAVT